MIFIFAKVLAVCVFAVPLCAQTEPSAAAQRTEIIRKREAWFHDQRAYPHQHIPRGARLNALRTVERMRAQERRARAAQPAGGGRSPLVASPASWSLIGPQPINVAPDFIGSGTPVAAGRVTALAVDPGNPNIVYLGAAQGGVWKSTDGGTTWAPLTDTQASLAVGSLTLDPSNPATVYVGTGEENFSGDSYYGAGILKSTDGGTTWAQIPGPFAGPIAADAYYGGGARIGSLAVHPTNGSILLAGVLGGGGDGVYRSSDSGLTWINVLPAGPATAVVFNPANANIAYAAVKGKGVFASSDAGQTWTADNGLSPNIISTFNIGRVELAIDPLRPATLYAGVSVASSQNLQALYKTTDGGAHWFGLPGPPQYCNPQCDYDDVVRVDPANSAVVYVGGSAGNDNRHTLWRSLDGGNTWAEVSQGANGVNLHVDQHALAFAADGSVLYSGNDGGAWRTSDVAASSVNWTNLNAPLAITQFYPGVSIDATLATRAFGGTQDNGMLEYAGGLAWNQLDPCGDGGYTAIDPSAPDTIYTACIQSEGVAKSTSGGAVGTWFSIANGLNTAERSNTFPPLVIDTLNSLTLYFGTHRVYQTNDGGNTWAVISPDLTLGGPTASVNTIAVAPSNSGTVYAGTSDGQVQVTTNAGESAGATWTNMSFGLPPRYITQIAVDPVDSMTAYMAFSGFSGFGDNLGHVFKTNSGGALWSDVSGNLPNIPVNDLVVDPNLPGTLYVATDVGVFSTQDGGTTWTTLMAGLPRVAILSLKMHAPSRILRAASHGRSAWDLPVPISNTLSISPNSLSFSPQAIGTSSSLQTVTLTNLSATALAISSIAASGDFAATNNCGASLAANASCPVQVSFVPSAQGPRTGTLTYSDNDPSGAQVVALTGAGTGGTTVTVSPTNLVFSNQPPTIPSSPQTVTLTNTGGATLNISSTTMTGAFGSAFAQTNNCGTSLAAGASCAIQVTFTPPLAANVPVPAGGYTGALAITDNATGSPQTVALLGTSADFQIGFAPGGNGTATITAGQTASYALTFTGLPSFSGSLALTCTGAPLLATCSVTPASVILSGSTASAATVSVNTTARSTSPPVPRHPTFWWWLLLAGELLSLTWLRQKPRRGGQQRLAAWRLTAAFAGLALLAASFVSGCGGGGSSSGGGQGGTPAGMYTLDVKATYTSGAFTLTHDVKLTLTVR